MKKALLALLVISLFSCKKDDADYTPSGNSGGGSSNNNSTWHYCGAPTKDGTPCQRHVSGTTGYCWQHD